MIDKNAVIHICIWCMEEKCGPLCGCSRKVFWCGAFLVTRRVHRAMLLRRQFDCRSSERDVIKREGKARTIAIQGYVPRLAKFSPNNSCYCPKNIVQSIDSIDRTIGFVLIHRYWHSVNNPYVSTSWSVHPSTEPTIMNRGKIVILRFCSSLRQISISCVCVVHGCVQFNLDNFHMWELANPPVR